MKKSNGWVHYIKGERAGEWRSREFSSRDEALAYARALGREVTVQEMPAHSTHEYERVTVHPDGREVSERGVRIG